MVKKLILAFLLLQFFSSPFMMGAEQTDSVTIIDSRHYSNVLGEIRNYRVFLPPGYNSDKLKRYPVIYFYHGWSQRYFGSGPDGYNHFEKGTDNNGDNIAAFVSENDVIVVKPDGYNRSVGEEYYLRPYNIGPVETSRQFPLYFPELVKHIDATYRTVPDRNHRAVSGLSMGGFMSFWIGGKYPDLICAIGNFCGSAEFVVGPKDFPVEYRNIDMFENYDGINVRLNFGNEDFIRYYHRDLNKVWLQLLDNYEYKIYQAPHVTCGMGEMFGFLLSSFSAPPEKPVSWNHIDVYPEFTIWDYRIVSDRDMPGFTILEKVNSRGFRCSVRQHLPDGELLSSVNLTLITPPLYGKNTSYIINDLDLSTHNAINYTLLSDNSGCLSIPFNGSLHEIGINKENDGPDICIGSYFIANMNYARHQSEVKLIVYLLNKGIKQAGGVKATLTPVRKSAVVTKSESDFGTIKMNETVKSGSEFIFNTPSDTTVTERFRLTITDKDRNTWNEFIEVPLFNKDLREVKDFQIADGRKVIVASQGTGADTLVLGTGNGDGIANPGESIAVLVKDGDKLRRTEIRVFGTWLNCHGENKRMSDNWGAYDHVGGSAKYSIPVISSSCPENTVISTVLEYWLPDSPDHIIKQEIVNFRISGNDKTPPTIEWVKVSGDNTILAKVIDGSPVKKVRAVFTLQKDPKVSFTADLNNEGENGDRVKNDNLFSCKIPVKGFAICNIVLSAIDSYGNKTETSEPGNFVIH